MTDNLIQVLDHGYVRLVGHMGNDLAIVRSARVSYNAEWRAGEDEGKDNKLIHYLYKNKHTTPFESVVFTFEVKAPIFVLRQWHRHRTWTYNEVSARYTELPEEFYIPKVEHIGTQSKNNKQVRDINNQDINYAALEDQKAWYIVQCEQTFDRYKYLLERGWPRELARMVLPLSTYSHMFATVDLHNLLHFIRLRDHEHAQFEIREYAKALKDLIKPIVPVTIEAFDSI